MIFQMLNQHSELEDKPWLLPKVRVGRWIKFIRLSKGENKILAIEGMKISCNGIAGKVKILIDKCYSKVGKFYAKEKWNNSLSIYGKSMYFIGICITMCANTRQI